MIARVRIAGKALLNLTETAIVLIAQSGETTTIPASGYVARVEYERRECDYFPIAKDDMTGTILKHHVPIIEETPREIVFVSRDEAQWRTGVIPYTQIPEHDLYLVPREVAEAAARVKHTCDEDEMCCPENCKPHPLAARMVWAAEPERRPRLGQYVTEYRALRRVAGVGR